LPSYQTSPYDSGTESVGGEIWLAGAATLLEKPLDRREGNMAVDDGEATPGVSVRMLSEICLLFAPLLRPLYAVTPSSMA
jgi:hypothetical protein